MATVFLVFIVFVAVMKNTFTAQVALAVAGVLLAVLALGFRSYQRVQKGSQS